MPCMKKPFLTATLLFLHFLLFAQTEEAKLERALFDLPDVSFKKIPTEPGAPPQYDIRVKQPLDHRHPEKGWFYQRLRLIHHGFERPVVMSTQGYQLNTGKNEIEAILDANHLNIEHRFFGESVPDPLQWEYLTLEQVTADLHHVNQLFRNIYTTKHWVSTGISKGGQTTIFYRYFYPDDVMVSIPYVAPFNNSLEDKRIYTFLDTVGSDECRKNIYRLQVFLLEHENEAVERIKWFSKGAGLSYYYLGSVEKAFEYAVLEYSFSFWQWGHSCDAIPTGDDLDTVLEYFLKVSDIGFFSDRDMSGYAPHYYQAATQMGYYGYNIAPFKKYLTQFKENPLATFAPTGSNPPPYDNSLNEKVEHWLQNKGDNFLYIYGGSDTWSADRITPSPKVNSKTYILPGKDHGQARIRNMSADMQQDFAEKLKDWLGTEVNLQKLNGK